MSKVKVTTSTNESTEIIGKSTNSPDYGYIRVESTEGMSFGNGGWLNTNRKTALIKGKLSDLTAFVKKNNVMEGYEIEGKIVVNESLTPFYATQQPKLIPSTGEILYKETSNGKEPIYRQTEFTIDMNKVDTLIQHSNVLSAAARVVVQNDIAIK
tara:strand:- start:1806 stop:2270 length:465 start_codon:yes stop_codon:yes gene_type:complete